MISNIEILYRNGWECVNSNNEELRGRCPSFNHIDVNPSFSINAITGAFRCFSCGFKGKHPATLLSGIKNISFQEACEEIFGEQFVDTKRKILDINMRLANYFYSVGIRERNVIKELLKRNCIPGLANKYCIGYVPEETTKYFTNEELELAGIMKNGFLLALGRMSFPIFSGNNVVGFSCRDLSGTSKRKYMSLYNKDYFSEDKWMYGMRSNERSVVVCEGVFDAIKIIEAGYNAAALLGSHCSSERMLLLRRFRNVVLAFDNDDAGSSAAERFFFESRNILKNNELSVSELFYGKDPDCLTIEQIKKVIDTTVPAMQWVIMKYFYQSQAPDKLVNNIKILSEKINSVDDKFERSIMQRLVEIRLDYGVTFDFNTQTNRFTIINY